MSFDSYEGASLHILAGGSVNISGNVTITGVDSTSNSLQETVTLSDGTTIDIDGSKKPTLDIRAGVDSNYIGTPKFTPNLLIEFNGQIPNTSTEPTNANINIQGIISNLSGSQSNSGEILVTNQYKPNGLAGNITTGKISTYGNVTVDSRSDITTNRVIDTIIYTDYLKKNTTAGNIRLLANQDILIDKNSKLFSYTGGNINGKGGDIYLNSQNGKIDINGEISSESTNGIAGSITIQALENISFSHSSITAISNNESKKYNNNITINSTEGSVDLNNSKLNTTNNGSGYAGYIIANASDKISILNGSEVFSKGNNGLLLIGINLIISTDNDGGAILDIDPNKIYTTQNVLIDNKSEINTNSNGSKEAGGIIINASDNISLLNESKIFSQGNSGLLLIGSNAVNYIGLQLSGIIDNPKSIIIDKSEININNNKGSEDAGYIKINASDQVSLLNGSKIFSQGNNGFININTGNLSLINGSQINSSLTAEGYRVGTIYIEAKDSVLLQGNPTLGNTNTNQTGIFTEIQSEGKLLSSEGKGNITLNTNKLIINDGARLSADTYGKGDAGDITVEAQQIDLKNQGRIISVVRENAEGNSGSVKLNSRTLLIADDARISVSNQGTGNAGNLTINAANSVSLERKGRISSSVRSTATGKGGNINIQTNFLTADGGIIESQNQGQGDGGNIAIKTQNLLLRRQSKITATAGSTSKPGNGGSIKINTENGFVVAVPSEDSDIIANAFGGKGGRIEINANRILGLQNQEKLSSEQLRKLENNGISDISASSDVGQNGDVSLNTLSIDPSQGLVTLPTNLVDPSGLIAQGCGSNSNVAKGQSEFVITGRGGLPPNPDDTLKPGAILPEWVVNNTVSNSNNSVNTTETNSKQLSSNTGDTLVEAVGMVRSTNGDIVFTAQPTTATLLQSASSTQACNVTQGNVR